MERRKRNPNAVKIKRTHNWIYRCMETSYLGFEGGFPPDAGFPEIGPVTLPLG
jgi:hypothetical protein